MVCVKHEGRERFLDAGIIFVFLLLLFGFLVGGCLVLLVLGGRLE